MVLVAGAVAAIFLMAGAPAALAGLAAAVVLLPPLPILLAVAGWAIVAWRRARPRCSTADDEADVLRGLAAELAAGASLRSGLSDAASRAPAVDLSTAVRLAGAGMPMPVVADAVARALPVNGRLAGSALRLAAETGAPVARLAADLAMRAADEGRLARERRALTAQARASAAVVGGTPVLLAGAAALTGRLGSLVESEAGPVVLGLGFGLQAAGIAVVWSMVRRATR